MSFGKYAVVTLGLARERHMDAQRLLPVGTDPMAKRKTDN
jgi:hypothetical protein